MPSLKYYLDSGKKASKLFENTITTKLSTQVGHILASQGQASKSEIEAFKMEIVNLVNSEDLLTKLSNEIGSPRETESEDEFINRAQLSLSRLLRTELDKTKSD